MDKTLGTALLDHGLLEVGVFQTEQGQRSFRLHLDMLPAYPMLLALYAQNIAAQLVSVDRLVCPPDSVPLGVAVSLQTQLPLVYSRGRGEAPVQDWVGAYDVGHPAALICNTLPDQATWVLWHKQLASVGLNVVQIIALLEIRSMVADVPVHSLMSLDEWLRSEPEMLPVGMVQTMLAELEK
jgi:hypothetical protein